MKLKMALITSVVVLFLGYLASSSITFIIGSYYNEDGDYPNAIKWFKYSSYLGNEKAKFNLGNKYANGEGVLQNYLEAEKWYKESAIQGYDKAQFNLANLYYKGIGIPKDIKQAEYWYKLSADQDNPRAAYNLGRIFYEQSKYREAFELFKKSANLTGDPASLHNIAMMYSAGKGIAQDKNSAIRYYEMAADKGYLDSVYNLGVIYAKGDGVEKDLNKATAHFHLICYSNLESKNELKQKSCETYRILQNVNN